MDKEIMSERELVTIACKGANPHLQNILLGHNYTTIDQLKQIPAISDPTLERRLTDTTTNALFVNSLTNLVDETSKSLESQMLTIGKKLDVLASQPHQTQPPIGSNPHLAAHVGVPVNYMQGSAGSSIQGPTPVTQPDLISIPQQQQTQSNAPMQQNFNGNQQYQVAQNSRYVHPNSRYNNNSRQFDRGLPFGSYNGNYRNNATRNTFPANNGRYVSNNRGTYGNFARQMGNNQRGPRMQNFGSGNFGNGRAYNNNNGRNYARQGNYVDQNTGSVIKLCFNCGSRHSMETTAFCKAWGKTCFSCGRQNHFSSHCRSNPKYQ